MKNTEHYKKFVTFAKGCEALRRGSQFLKPVWYNAHS